jgi:hypothetical protein
MMVAVVLGAVQIEQLKPSGTVPFVERPKREWR